MSFTYDGDEFNYIIQPKLSEYTWEMWYIIVIPIFLIIFAYYIVFSS